MPSASPPKLHSRWRHWLEAYYKADHGPMYYDMTTKQSHASRYADEMSRCAARHACRCSQRGSGSCKLVYARSKQRSMTNRPTARDRQNSTERPRRILTERQQHHRRTNRGWDQCLFQACFFWGGGFSPSPAKKLIVHTKTASKLCARNVFFRPGQWITNASRKLSFYRQ